MKASQWRQAVKNRCRFSARLKVLSGKSGDCSASGRCVECNIEKN